MAVFAIALAAGKVSAETRIKCASTTSTQNSGLFDYLLPIFTKKTGIQMDVVAVGTGAAIEIGKRGDADVVFVHAKPLEVKAVEEGYFVNRHDVMYNDFVIVGPPNDPAKVKGLKSATEAFKKIVPAARSWPSGRPTALTPKGKNGIWRRARAWVTPCGWPAKRKLTPSRIGLPGWPFKDKENLKLALFMEGDPILFNQYGVMAVNPEKHKNVKYK